MKILNLFCGIGGNRTLWGNEHEITAIDNDQQVAMIYLKRFPKDVVIVGDAYQYLEQHYSEFDFIWASPPCPTHSRLMFLQVKKKLPDMRLYSIIMFLKHHYYGKWIVENVKSYYSPLVKPTAIVDRHYIWANFKINTKRHFLDRKSFDYLSIEDFKKMHQVNEEGVTRKMLRNMNLPEVGKYILDSIHEKNLKEFL